MAKEFKFELNREGVRELMQSAAMKSVINDKAQRIVQFCGEGYEMESRTGRTRTSATVHTATPHAYYSNLKHNTLEKAVRSAKG